MEISQEIFVFLCRIDIKVKLKFVQWKRKGEKMISCENILNKLMEQIESLDLKIVELALQDVLKNDMF